MEYIFVPEIARLTVLRRCVKASAGTSGPQAGQIWLNCFHSV